MVSVQVTIQNPDGTIDDQSNAVPSETEGLWWIYTTTSQVPIVSGLRVIVTTKDLPGNAEGLVWQNN